MTQPAHFDSVTMRVASAVHHRLGDGMLEIIPLGQEVEVTEAIATMVLSWREEGQGINAILAKQEYQHYLQTGAIVAV